MTRAFWLVAAAVTGAAAVFLGLAGMPFAAILALLACGWSLACATLPGPRS